MKRNYFLKWKYRISFVIILLFLEPFKDSIMIKEFLQGNQDIKMSPLLPKRVGDGSDYRSAVLTVEYLESKMKIFVFYL